MEKLRDYFAVKLSCQTPWNEHNIVCNAKDIDKLFVFQESKMDCGLACIRMIYYWASEATFEMDFRSFRFPMWTIDMFMVLSHANVCDVQFFTTFCGVGPHHRKLQWYTCVPDALPNNDDNSCNTTVDEEFNRVSELYQYGKEQQWNIHERLLDTYDIVIALIEKKALVIMLVDSITLKSMQKNLFYNIFTSTVRKCYENSPNDFAGHYIVIIGNISAY